MPTRTTRKGVTAAKRASKAPAPKKKAPASKPQAPAPAHDPSAPLENAQHERFCCEYAKDSNGAQAYMRTYGGDNASAARASAARLLANASVRDRADHLVGEALADAKTEASKVLQAMARVAFMDIRQAFDEKGALRPIHQLPAEIAMCIGGLEVVEMAGAMAVNIAAKGEEPVLQHVPMYTKKLKFNDRLVALANLGKHFKLFTEKVEVAGPGGGPIAVEQQESAESKAARVNFDKRLAACESAISR